MKPLWTGTDSLMLIDYSMRKLSKRPYWMMYRLFARLVDYFCQEHYADSEQIAENLRKFGMKRPVKVFKDRVNYPIATQKIQHSNFNVFYYHPAGGDSDYIQWLYGIDLIIKLKRQLKIPGITFFRLDGSLEMSDIYPIMDFYLRPNRHDGTSRMIQECEINQIPYYHSTKDPDYEEMRSMLLTTWTEFQSRNK